LYCGGKMVERARSGLLQRRKGRSQDVGRAKPFLRSFGQFVFQPLVAGGIYILGGGFNPKMTL